MSCDAVAANKAFHEKFDFAFPLLSDVDKSMTKAFGVCKPAKDGSDPCDKSARVTVVVGADGTVDISPSARLFIKESAIVQALYDGLKLLLDAEKAAAPAEA